LRKIINLKTREIKSGFIILYKTDTPASSDVTHYELTVPAILVLEFLLKLGINIKISTKKHGQFEGLSQYTVKAELDDLHLPNDTSNFSVLANLDHAIKESLIYLLNINRIFIDNGILKIRKQ